MEKINFEIKWIENGWVITDIASGKQYVCEKSENDTFFATERLPAVLNRILAGSKKSTN